jgi:hypothetical protein
MTFSEQEFEKHKELITLSMKYPDWKNLIQSEN